MAAGPLYFRECEPGAGSTVQPGIRIGEPDGARGEIQRLVGIATLRGDPTSGGEPQDGVELAPRRLGVVDPLAVGEILRRLVPLTLVAGEKSELGGRLERS